MSHPHLTILMRTGKLSERVKCTNYHTDGEWEWDGCLSSRHESELTHPPKVQAARTKLHAPYGCGGS